MLMIVHRYRIDIERYIGRCNRMTNTVAGRATPPLDEDPQALLSAGSMGYDHHTMRLYDQGRGRLYINAEERARFERAASNTPPMVRSLAMTLLYTGCRLSEALELTGASLQPGAKVVTFRTLKRRSPGIYREVPIPEALIQIWRRAHAIDQATPLYAHLGTPINRITAYRWIKALMAEASIAGPQATPKGLRHGFGVHAIHSGVPLNLVQRWMGHAHMRTTAIYADASGAEERAIAERMWG